MWTYHDNTIRLDSPTSDQCEVVKIMMSQLGKEEQTGKELSISLWSSSPESAAVIINDLNKYTVRRLYIRNTELDSVCISKLSEILETNETIRRLELWSCKFIGGFKQVGDILSINTILEELVLWHITGITDENISHFSDKLAANKSLKILWLSYCNIIDNGIQNICEGLAKNKTLTELNIGGNDQITSASTGAIEDLIKATTSLTDLRIYGTSLNDDDIKRICTSLTENTTITKLYLSREYKEYCEEHYKEIIGRLDFSYY